MGFIAAGIATAVGAGISAYGASKSAAATKKANQSAAGMEEELYADQSKKLNRLINQKENKLNNLGNIFDRFESTGAFGDTDTLKNLRTAQSDFSQLAAGDFSGFEAQLRKSMSDALVGTVGSGSPVGSYAQLAADTQLQYRKEGIQTSMGISEFLGNQASQLLGAEFGIMDQKFQSQYNLARTKASNVANYSLGAAATEGVGMTAFGGALSQVGSAVASYNMYNKSYDLQSRSLDIAQQQANAMKGMSQRGVPNYDPMQNGGGGSAINLNPTGAVNDPIDVNGLGGNGMEWGPDGKLRPVSGPPGYREPPPIAQQNQVSSLLSDFPWNQFNTNYQSFSSVTPPNSIQGGSNWYQSFATPALSYSNPFYPRVRSNQVGVAGNYYINNSGDTPMVMSDLSAMNTLSEQGALIASGRA